MKKLTRIFIYVFLFAISSIIANAQTSQRGFSFQGYAVDPDGKALGSTGITVSLLFTQNQVDFHILKNKI